MKRLYCLNISLLVAGCFVASSPATLAQFGYGSIQLPQPPTVGDIQIMNSDERLYESDSGTVRKWEDAVSQYKQTMDRQLSSSRAALPGVQTELKQFSQRYNKAALDKMLADPNSRYAQLTHWLAQEQAAEKEERDNLARYQKKLAMVRSQHEADRINIRSDQQSIRDAYKAYVDRAYSEQKEVAGWNLQQQPRLLYGPGTLPGSAGGNGYGGYGGVRIFGGSFR